MAVKKEWTNDEELVVINQVKANPQNLQKAFAEASRILNRSQHAVSLRWYLGLREKSGIVFMTCSHKKATVNKKVINNNSIETPTKVTKNILYDFITKLFKRNKKTNNK